MSRFPTTPLPSDGSPLQMPYLPTAQQQAPGPSSWEQFSQVLQGLGNLASKAIDIKTDMTVAEARQKAIDNREEAQRLEAERQQRQDAAKVELAQLRLDYAGNPEGLSKAMAGFLQKHHDEPTILDDGLNVWRGAREEVLKVQHDNAETILKAKRDGFIRQKVLGFEAQLKTDPDLQRQAAADPVQFLDNVTKQTVTYAESQVGQMTDVEKALLLDSAANAVNTKLGSYVLGSAEKLRTESDKAEWAVTSDALLDGMTADNVGSVFDVYLSGEKARGTLPAVAQINASGAVLENITRIRGADPVSSMTDRLRAVDALAANPKFVGNPTAIRDRIVSDFRRESDESFKANLGRIVGTTQVAASGALKRNLDNDEALALWANGTDNAVGQIVDATVPASSDPVVAERRTEYAATLTDRITKGKEKLATEEAKAAESQLEYSKAINGLAADSNKAYEVSAVRAVLSGSPSVNEDTAKRAGFEIGVFSRGTMPEKMATDINNGLMSQNPKVRELSLTMLKSVPPDVQGNLFTTLSKGNAEVGVAAMFTVITAGSGKVADEGAFFEQMRSAVRSFPDLMRTPMQWKSDTPSIQAALRPLKASGAVHLTQDDEIDPNSERLYKAMLAMTMSSPTATALGGDVDAIAKATYESMPAWGLKWVRQGNRVSIVKDAFGYVPRDGMTDQDTVNETVRTWMLDNPDGVIRALDQDRQRRAERIATREGIEVSAALRRTDRPYVTGDGKLNPDFVRNLTFQPSLDSGQLAMPPESPYGGLPFVAFYDGRMVDTFVDGSPFSAITIKDFGRQVTKIKDPPNWATDLAIDAFNLYRHPVDTTIRALQDAGPLNPYNKP